MKKNLSALAVCFCAYRSLDHLTAPPSPLKNDGGWSDLNARSYGLSQNLLMIPLSKRPDCGGMGRED
jgi:hypothetical protein